MPVFLRRPPSSLSSSSDCSIDVFFHPTGRRNSKTTSSSLQQHPSRWSQGGEMSIVCARGPQDEGQRWQQRRWLFQDVFRSPLERGQRFSDTAKFRDIGAVVERQPPLRNAAPETRNGLRTQEQSTDPLRGASMSVVGRSRLGTVEELLVLRRRRRNRRGRRSRSDRPYCL